MSTALYIYLLGMIAAFTFFVWLMKDEITEGSFSLGVIVCLGISFVWPLFLLLGLVSGIVNTIEKLAKKED